MKAFGIKETTLDQVIIVCVLGLGSEGWTIVFDSSWEVLFGLFDRVGWIGSEGLWIAMFCCIFLELGRFVLGATCCEILDGLSIGF